MFWARVDFRPGWWLVRDCGLTLTLLYGPFTEQEAVLAASIHRVPLPADEALS
jgi:hypothetical protein